MDKYGVRLANSMSLHQANSYRHRAGLVPSTQGKLPTVGEHLSDRLNIYRVAVEADSSGHLEVDLIGSKTMHNAPPIVGECIVFDVIRSPVG
jgi:hypothetical protein